MYVLVDAGLTSVNGASFFVSLSTGAGATGAASAAGAAGVELSATAGGASVVAGVGAVAGAGAAGAVSVLVGSAALLEAAVVAVGWCSVFFVLLFFLKRPLKAFFSWSIASGAVVVCELTLRYQLRRERDGNCVAICDV